MARVAPSSAAADAAAADLRRANRATWLGDGDSDSVRTFRSAWLLCLFTGLVQKPLVRMAWDVQVTVKVMAALRRGRRAPEVLGMTLILLRQVYAQKGQEIVGDMARALGLHGRWTAPALRKLAGALEDEDRNDNRKDKGRMRAFTGPAWVRLIAGDSSHLARLRAAGQLLGQTMAASAAAETDTFSFYFDKLTSKAGKLPKVATYGVCGWLRALCAVLADMGRPPLSITEADWVRHLRDMTLDTTAEAFREVQVRALADAQVMVAVIKVACSKFMGFRRAAEWRLMDVMDLSCQSCEFFQVLRAVQRAEPQASTYNKAAAWLLEHLPRHEVGIRLMSKSLRLRRSKVHGKGNGLDLQSGKEVATAWLNDRTSVVAPAVAEGEGCASEVLERFLPRSRCAVCSLPLYPPFRSCQGCRVDQQKKWCRQQRAGISAPKPKRLKSA